MSGLNALETTLEAAQASVIAKPWNGAAWCQLGLAHYLLAGAGPGHYLEAHNAFERAYAMAPHEPSAMIGLGSSVFTLGNHDQALDLFRRAQSERPHPKARLAEAGVLLLLRQWQEGWEKHEARRDEPISLPALADLAGKTVVVEAEQAYGDCILFLRYVRYLRPFCKRVMLAMHPSLETLADALIGKPFTSDWMPTGGSVAIPIMSLPLLLGPDIGYEPAPPLPVPDQFIKPRHGIGLCPASLPPPGSTDPYAYSMCARKNPPMDMLIDLAGEFGPFDFLSHAALKTKDWLQTASVLASFDLVISVDTAVAHLAATLGLETWVMQRFDGCWRWDSWYPNARIFRQAAPGDWGSVYSQIGKALNVRTQSAQAART